MTPSPSPHGPMTPLHKKAKGLRNRQRAHLHPGSTQNYKGRLRRVSPISNPPQNHLFYPSYCPRLLPPLLVNSRRKVITSLWHSASDGPLSFVNLHSETFLLCLFHLIFSTWKEKGWYPGRNCLWEHDCLPLFSVTLSVCKNSSYNGKQNKKEIFGKWKQVFGWRDMRNNNLVKRENVNWPH